MKHPKEFTSETLDKHIKEDHGITTVSTFLQEIVYGGVDGIVTTFAVVAGFTGANNMSEGMQLPALTVLLFGLANLFGDATSMGLGNLLSVRSAQKVRHRHEALEKMQLIENIHFEKEETLFLLKQKGFSDEQAQQMTETMAANPEYWLEFMMMYELEMPFDDEANPILTGLATFLSFIVFGIIPLLPYIITQANENTFYISIGATAFALIALGFLRWKVTNEKLLASVIEVLTIGSVSAAVAYFVGTLFTL